MLNIFIIIQMNSYVLARYVFLSLPAGISRVLLLLSHGAFLTLPLFTSFLYVIVFLVCRVRSILRLFKVTGRYVRDDGKILMQMLFTMYVSCLLYTSALHFTSSYENLSAV